MADPVEQQGEPQIQPDDEAQQRSSNGENGQSTQQQGEHQNGADQTQSTESDGQPQSDDTFSREYVQQLRTESAGYRTANKDLRAALWAAKVSAAGRLADPADLPMPDDADPTDSEQITAAIDDLLAAKPHYAARKATGDIGQHSGTDEGQDVSIVGMMQRSA